MGLIKGELSTRELILKIIEEKEGKDVTFLDMINISKKYKTPLTERVIEYFLSDAMSKIRKAQNNKSSRRK